MGCSRGPKLGTYSDWGLSGVWLLINIYLIILATTPQRVKQYHRRKYASICICVHIHTYTHVHICAQSAASVFADVYVGVKTHLCNLHTCPCTSAQNTCKVHTTPTAKNAHTCIPTHIFIRMHMHTNTHAHA